MPVRIFRILFSLAGFLSAVAVPAATVVVNDESGTYHDTGCGATGAGQCTLVDAIVFANANPGADAVHFNLPGGGTRTIVPSAPLPALTDDAGVTIDGFTQPGASPNTLSAASNAVWRVRLSGGSLIAQGAGILVESDNNVVRGLIVERWISGIEIVGASGNRVSGNLLGGDVPADFANGNGVALRAGAHDNTVGGTLPADRNVTSGNVAGIYLTDSGTSSNVIQGNIVGLSPAGTTPVRNFRGISFFQGSLPDGPGSNLIGGSVAGAANVISGNETNGIDFGGFMTGNRIEGNRIGTTPDGTAAVGNLQAGVSMFGGPHGNVVGGTAAGAGNLISGNGVGVIIESFGTDDNRIEGNRIGTNPQGDAAIPNGGGVGISLGARGNMVGGTSSAARNVISGNLGGAVGISLADENAVVGNYLGTDASGTGRVGNGKEIVSAYSAVQIASGSRNRVESNVIAYNGSPLVGGGGILVLEGNQPGDTVGNQLLGNSIHDNYGLGIDLYEPGIPYRATPNDVGDGDSGANELQNYPVIQAVSFPAGSVMVTGTLNSEPSTPYTLQFFASHRCDDSGNGEGEFFLGSSPVSTDVKGNASFQANFPLPTAAARRLTATATDPAGNTSEFSECFPRASSFYTVSPCRVADTRDPGVTPGGPLLAGSEREFPVTDRCGIPESAQAVSFNFTVTAPSHGGHFTVYPPGNRVPLASTLNFRAAQTRANNAIVRIGTGGSIAIVSSQPAGGTAHVVVDVNGYFE